MKVLAAAFLLAFSTAASTKEPALPIASGTYAFQLRSSEHPDMDGIPLVGTIHGTHIELVSETVDPVWPKGVLAEGTLMWHAASERWIIGDAESDRSAAEVGACSDGPEVVDLAKRIYWTC